jgi:hypothetical protein
MAARTIGNVLEWYDFSIYGFFAAAIGPPLSAGRTGDASAGGAHAAEAAAAEPGGRGLKKWAILPISRSHICS